MKFSLVTGASGGIGKEIAKELGKRGNNLVLVARSKKGLEEFAKELVQEFKVRVLIISVDLSKEDSAKYIYNWCKENEIQVDCLINNAGAAVFGEFEKLDIEKQTEIINLNVNSLVKLSRYFISELIKCSKGYILNVASIAAFYPLPYYSVYGATKAFVLSFTEALRFEMRNYNVNVCCLCPGDTETNFFKNAGNKNSKKNLMSPKIVAEIAVSGLLNNEALIRPKYVKNMTLIPR
ncbi:MAG: SDR family oxidoreductase, partial [Bacillota bacterium]|nr:SDR family oxidoreductase [Bacillota bacterium]